MKWVHMTHLKTAKNLQLNICNGHLLNKDRNLDLKAQKVQKTVNKGGIILPQVTQNLIR